MMKRGKPPLKNPLRENVTVPFTTAQKWAVVKAAVDRGMPMGAYIREIVCDHLGIEHGHTREYKPPVWRLPKD